MFSGKQIIYFNEFYFKNGNQSKPKYFIVLANVGDRIIIASLPTRTNKVPSFVTTHGCINLDARCYNAYYFDPNRIVGEKGFSFDMPTFIYGDQVEDYEKAFLAENYIQGVDYVILDMLHQAEFDAIIQCFLNSGSVKHKIKRYLQ